MHAKFSRAGNQRQRQLFMQVCACTHELVDSALHASWDSVLDGMDRRRQLMTDLEKLAGSDQGNLQAITAAVSESEQVLWGVIAHAIAGSRHHSAPQSLFM